MHIVKQAGQRYQKAYPQAAEAVTEIMRSLERKFGSYEFTDAQFERARMNSQDLVRALARHFQISFVGQGLDPERNVQWLNKLLLLKAPDVLDDLKFRMGLVYPSDFPNDYWDIMSRARWLVLVLSLGSVLMY